MVIGVNVRNADIKQVVSKIQESLDKNVKLKPGYYFEYGGQFENLQNAIDTLTVVIPIALLLILLLLFFAFRSVIYSLVVFSTVPLSLIGGIVALWLRGLPFSISAGVGFIALFGVAVLNGILMINHFNDLRKKNEYTMCTGSIIRHGCPHLLRPVFLTGLVASLGFVPMAIATSAGAEVQRPLATVVIGGLIVSTALTLIIIPVFYKLVNNISYSIMRRKNSRKTNGKARAIAMTAIILSFAVGANAQSSEAKRVSMEEAIEIALQNHPRLKVATAEIEKARASKGEIWDGGSTSFSYAWGQLNGEYNKDNEMSIEQSLGSFITPFYKNALVKSQVSTGEYYRNMVKKEIIAEVKRAWTYYQYANSIYSLYKHQDEIAGKLKQSGDLRYSQGDIDLTEKNMISAMAANMRTMLLHWQEELSLAGKRLTWVCYSDRQILPSDNSLAIFQSSDTDLLPSADHLNYFLGKVDEQKKTAADRKKQVLFLIPEKGDKFIPLSTDSILFFYISDGQVKAVNTDGKQYPFTLSLDELAEMLNPKLFFRANRQFLISRKAIKDISLWFNGRLVINLNIPMDLKDKIIISKAKASEFKEWF